jgi:hypothetical protein
MKTESDGRAHDGISVQILKFCDGMFCTSDEIPRQCTVYAAAVAPSLQPTGRSVVVQDVPGNS